MLAHLTYLLATTSTTVASTKKTGASLLDPIAKPIAALLAYIYGIIPNYGVAILVLSVLWMIVISPLTLKSTRSMLAMQKLQPQLKALQEKHKDDRQAFAQAQMDLFREHQVSPFGSCLPMLLPLPVFFALFRVIDGLSHIGKNGVADPKYLSPGTRMFRDIVAAHGHLNAFGVDLSHNAFSSHSSFFAALPYWVLLLVMAGTSYLQTIQTMSRNQNAAQNPQMRMMKFLPLVFVLFSLRFPAGVILYYSMSNVCRIIQQDLMYRFDPKVKALVVKEVQEVEAITRDIDERRGRPRMALEPGGRADTGSGKPAGQSKMARFRELLAAAAEQQPQKNKPGTPNAQKLQKPQTPVSRPKEGKPVALGPTGNGSGQGGAGRATTNGQRSGRARSAKRNRKRRSR